MIESFAAYPLLTGLRGQPAALATALSRLPLFAAAIESLDINPFLVRPDGALALDAVLVTPHPPKDRTRRAVSPQTLPSAPVLGIQSLIGNPESGGPRSPPGSSMTGPDKCGQSFGTQAISIRSPDHPIPSYMCGDIDLEKTHGNNDLHASTRNWASPIVTNLANNRTYCLSRFPIHTQWLAHDTRRCLDTPTF